MSETPADYEEAIRKTPGYTNPVFKEQEESIRKGDGFEYVEGGADLNDDYVEVEKNDYYDSIEPKINYDSIKMTEDGLYVEMH